MSEDNSKLKVGDRATDGWVYAGVSVDTGKPMFVAPADAGEMNWNDATQAANALGARLPSKGELAQVFNSQSKIGGFKETGLSVAALKWVSSSAGDSYWSSSADDHYEGCAKIQRSSDGHQDFDFKSEVRSVRFVRS